jgi:hypothetical protein
MARKPKNDGRKSDGTFAPGNSLGGKTKGSRHKATMAVESLLDGQVEQLTQKAVDAALAGDMTAMRLCLERLCPPRKDVPITFTMPDMKCSKDAASAVSEILKSVSDGEITPNEASGVTAIVEVYRKTLETTELETRLRALEQVAESRRT